MTQLALDLNVTNSDNIDFFDNQELNVLNWIAVKGHLH